MRGLDLHFFNFVYYSTVRGICHHPREKILTRAYGGVSVTWMATGLWSVY